MAFMGHMIHANFTGCDGRDLAERYLPTVEAALNSSTPDACYPDFTLPKHWDTFCSLFEVAARIYVCRALRDRAIEDDVVQSLTREGISLLIDEGLPGMLAHCVIWPIMVSRFCPF